MPEVINDTIHVGDAVQVIARDEYQSVQSQNIVGVVVKIFYAEGSDIPNAYGVRSNGEVVYYIADHIQRVHANVRDCTDEDRLCLAIADDIVDQMMCKAL